MAGENESFQSDGKCNSLSESMIWAEHKYHRYAFRLSQSWLHRLCFLNYSSFRNLDAMLHIFCFVSSIDSFLLKAKKQKSSNQKPISFFRKTHFVILVWTRSKLFALAKLEFQVLNLQKFRFYFSWPQSFVPRSVSKPYTISSDNSNPLQKFFLQKFTVQKLPLQKYALNSCLWNLRRIKT